ncbi:Phosphotransferase enzyme family protein [Planctomycetes bacterium Poly30]|uniref:Phosphotransferase enzyme family protein n=1 Tax=Saltatorellus ferox TaxID=2528018 RepID=A0A518EL73_9BACT|nr:Phosphotransferase enzyme family protein [Planctomycetes bacterium Poly30]
MDTQHWIEAVTGLQVRSGPELVQELWSGFGRLERFHLSKGHVIVKAVDPGARGGAPGHPRGWDTDLSAERKQKSYRVERVFYSEYALRLEEEARVPALIAARETATGGEMILEDLDAAGFAGRPRALEDGGIRACLGWLARFHGAFLGSPTDGLWERGTYWHLETRPDELEAIRGTPLGEAASDIDRRLSAAQHRTLVHGDAKLANFCFAPGAANGASASVAAVDFQYVGGGVGVQDVAYFLGSCLDDGELAAQAAPYLDLYFEALRSFPGCDAALEDEWRELWPHAWADFHRFLAGWSPGHWKLSVYSEGMVRRIIAR